MADIQSPRVSLTVQLPQDLIDELRLVAREKQLSIDEVVMEACLGYTEPFLWEGDYRKWCADQPEKPSNGVPADNQSLAPRKLAEGTA